MVGINVLLVISALMVIPLMVIVIVITIAFLRRSNRQPIKMPRHCTSCQTSFEPASPVFPQCGYSLDRP